MYICIYIYSIYAANVQINEQLHSFMIQSRQKAYRDPGAGALFIDRGVLTSNYSTDSVLPTTVPCGKPYGYPYEYLLVLVPGYLVGMVSIDTVYTPVLLLE